LYPKAIHHEKQIDDPAGFRQLWTTQTVSAQKIKVQEGSLSTLQGVSKINISFDYSDMSVGKFDREADYVARKRQNTIRRKQAKVNNGSRTGSKTVANVMHRSSKNCSTRTA
jgi:hypothetical protein